jgi:hypothetical protein
MRKVVLIAALTLAASQAHAGCSTYGVDGPLADAPKAVVCLQGKCDETIELTECSAGPGGHWITYGNGVTVTADGKGKIIAIHRGSQSVPHSVWNTLVVKENDK